MKDGIPGAYGDEAAVFGMVAAPEGPLGVVSSLVIVNPVGSLPDPLGFRLLVAGPDGPLGEAGRDRFRGVSVADVLPDIA